jgi:DNA-binding beta-propeller fold protein YncE
MYRVGFGSYLFEPVADWYRLPADVRLAEAIGVAIDSNDNLFVFNRGEPSVIVLDRKGEFLNAWGVGLFVRPHGIWIAPDDTLYLTDDMGHSVRQFTADGTEIRTIGPSGIPSNSGADAFDHRTITQGAGPYNLPTNVVTTADGQIFVADGYGNVRIHHFSHDAQLIKSWGQLGNGPGEFRFPHGIGIDSSGILYVADRENSRIQIFSQDGTYLREWTDVIRPCKVHVTEDDTVYVAELGTRNGLFPWMERKPDAIGGRVSIFNSEGDLLSRWGGGDDATQVGEFYAAHDIAVDSQGDVYVGEVAVTAAALAGDDPNGLPTLRKFCRV